MHLITGSQLRHCLTSYFPSLPPPSRDMCDAFRQSSLRLRKVLSPQRGGMCVLGGWTRGISGNLWIDWATQRNQASKIPSEQTKTKHNPFSNNISANFPLYFIAKIWVSLTGANSLQGCWPTLFCWERVSQVWDYWRFGWCDCVCVLGAVLRDARCEVFIRLDTYSVSPWVVTTSL